MTCCPLPPCCSALSVRLPSTALFDYPSVEQLAAWLTGQVADAALAPQPADPAAGAAEAAATSEEEGSCSSGEGAEEEEEDNVKAQQQQQRQQASGARSAPRRSSSSDYEQRKPNAATEAAAVSAAAAAAHEPAPAVQLPPRLLALPVNKNAPRLTLPGYFTVSWQGEHAVCACSPPRLTPPKPVECGRSLRRRQTDTFPRTLCTLGHPDHPSHRSTCPSLLRRSQVWRGCSA
jgi:hypothetical protein